MAYRAGQCGDCSKSDEGTAVGYSCGIPLLRGAAGHCGSIKTGQKTDAKKQEIGRYVEQDPGKCFWKNGPVCFKRRKNKPGRGTSFSCAPAYMGFFKNTGTACRTRNRYVCTGPFTNRAGLFYKNSRKNKRNKKTVT